MQEEPSILASLGIDPTTLTPPPAAAWDTAMQAAFDPSASADPDTVPDMDDVPPDVGDGGDDDVLDGLVPDEPGHQHAPASPDEPVADDASGSADVDHGDDPELDLTDHHHDAPGGDFHDGGHDSHDGHVDL